MPETTKRLDRAELAKRVERAEKLLQKGKTTEALEEYLLVLRDDPDNDVVRQLAADLCLSVSRNADAVSLLGDLFERSGPIVDGNNFVSRIREDLPPHILSGHAVIGEQYLPGQRFPLMRGDSPKVTRATT